MPASASATWGARSSELTRARTATCSVPTPGSASQVADRLGQHGRPVLGRVRPDLQRAGVGVGRGSGPDDLVDPTPVVREEVAGGVDDRDRAAVVHLERVVGGAGEQAGEVEQEGRVGAGVAVDDLVVVAHAEHVEARRGQQPHQEHVGRREVLQLVDQQVAAAGLGPAAVLAVAQEELDRGVDLLVEVDGAHGGAAARGTGRRRRPGRGRRPARPRPRPGRAGRAARARAPRGRGRAGRCWPGGAGPGPAPRPAGAPRAPPAPGERGPGPRPAASSRAR